MKMSVRARFLEWAQESGGISLAEAEKLMRLYSEHGILKVDVVNGSWQFAHGAAAERDVIRRIVATH
jgi:hypothetical protein